MAIKTNTYKLEYFKQGAYYGSQSDSHRFLTMDYNLESYVGVMGVGVLHGWEIDPVSGLTIQILPGEGIINGFYSESPYVVKQRSDMVAGDREVEVLNEDDIPEPALTPTQRAQYVSVVQLYDPTFDDPSVGDIPNYYVKVVIPTLITVANNTDTFIYAKRPSSATPYPLLSDYPLPAGAAPVRNNYSDYASYQAALNVYNAKLTAIHNYNWYDNSVNHFTTAEFTTSTGLIKSDSKVLLGKVLARNGEITKVDISEVNNLANLESEIKQVATDYLVNHIHGGSKSFDPPKIKLESDLHYTSFWNYNGTTGLIVYKILERDPTSITLGHKHTYAVDSDGNGQTADQIGSIAPHFHKISTFVIGNPEQSSEAVTAHIHTIANTSSASTWDDNSKFVAYVNGKVFGNETTPYIHLNNSQLKVTFDKGVSASNSKYSTSFSVTLLNPYYTPSSTVEPQTTTYNYSYENRNVSIYQFMLQLELNFYQTYERYFSASAAAEFSGSELTDSQSNIIDTNLNTNNPFVFVTDNGYAGLTDLNTQSSAAQSLLKKEGDTFTFTPNAAKNITITLVEVGSIDQVEIEFLGNTEVTGKLRPESIVYLNANKILTGEFLPQVLPFVSHVGRIKEECFPLQYAMMSVDGIRYSVVPTVTDIALGHYHKMLVDTATTGATTEMMIANEPVYYQTYANNTYYVYHAHGVQDGNVFSMSSTGLLNWQNNVHSTSLTSSDHMHNVIYPVIGNEKTIYAIREDMEGNIYVGTSDGFMLIPQDPAYQFIVNGLELSFYGSNLWSILVDKVAPQYEAFTHVPLVITQEIYGAQLDVANLDAVGGSVLLTGTPYPDRMTDQIMIKRISSFPLPNFGYLKIESLSSVLPSETIISQDNVNAVVTRDFDNIPIWSIELNVDIHTGQTYVSPDISTDVIVTGSNLIAKSIGLNKTPYQPWSSITIPFAVNVIRKTVKDADGNYWASTNNGVLVSRSYSSGNIFEFASLPGGNPDVQDILCGERSAVYCASSSGIFKTTDGGKTWAKSLSGIGGFKQVIRDRSQDKSTIFEGHYHKFDVDNYGTGFLSESIGAGTPHVHIVTRWNVASTMGHTHTMIVTLYAVDYNKMIWKSEDNGSNWVQYGYLPDGECGDVFAAFGFLFVSQQLGLYKSGNGSSWQQILTNKVYSYEWSYDMSELLMGSNNKLYGTFDGVNFAIVYSFDGKPSPILIDNDTQQYFGYAYNNQSQTFHFKNQVLSSDKLAALVDFEKWYAQNGGWSASSPSDVYINYKRVLSSKYNEDKRDLFGYHFELIPSNGELDFSATTQLTQPVNIYDDSLFVENSAGFSIGDSIVVTSANASSLYTTIVAVNGNVLTLGANASQTVTLPSAVKKIPTLDGQASILVNVYDSPLSHAGKLTHDQVEDGLSAYSDGRPYKFNDTYLSNLLQLTQAVRYAYPDINSEFINDMFYDFRYSWSPSDPIYPDINEYIDIVTSEIYNQKVYDDNFVGEWAKSINKILIGFGPFVGKIVVATDIGIFMSNLVPSFEANWFYINDLPYAAYDLMIFNGTRLYAATSNGTYYTEDLKVWQREQSISVTYPSYSLGLRWVDQSTIVIPAHSAQFIANTTTGLGTVIAVSGTPYSGINANQGIKIDFAGDKSGSYVVSNVGDSGGGYGSQIIVSPTFQPPTEEFDGVRITVGTWWNQWDGDLNTLNSNITNTLLIGGENHISYNDGNGSWFESTFGNASNFTSRKFLPLSSGRALLATTGTNSANMINYLLKSDDIGKNWDIFNQFGNVIGNISSSSISDFNNTVLQVAYTKPVNYIYLNGILDQQDIAVFPPNSSIALFRGKVVWNEKNNGNDTITVYGNGLASIVAGHTNYTFVVSPAKVNTMIESSQGTVFYGTNKGLYSDVNTVASNNYPEGSVTSVGVNAIVQSVDISGSIVSITIDGVTGNTVLSVTTDIVVRGRELIGKFIYVTDTNPVEKYDIVDNTSLAPGEEFTIQVSVTNPLSSAYIGKKIRIVGSHSNLYVNFDGPVSPNQFSGGVFYITSTDGNNLGKSYNIVSNSANYLELDAAIIPNTTMTGITTPTNIQTLDEYLATPSNPDFSYSTVANLTLQSNSSAVQSTLADNALPPVKAGQSIRMVDASGKLTLWVTLDRTVKENALQGLSIQFNSEALSANVGSVSIYSNLKNSLTIPADHAADFTKGDAFVIKGAFFEQVGGFSHLKTSIDSDHYHDVETVNAMVSGSILSFSNNNASYVDINVTDTTNFNTPLVQYSGDLFTNAQIVFTTTQTVSLRYISEVVSYTPTSIRVRIKSSSYWNFASADPLKISEGWQWEIDGTDYGYTNGITYTDFVVMTDGVTATAQRGYNQISVNSTAGVLVGDKIRIQDSTLSSEINYVGSIVNSTTLQLVSVLTKTYFLKNNPQIKVLRDAFANTHIHQIRNNEVQSLSITEYLDNGYPTQHSHRVLPLIADVSVLLNQNNNVTVFGSSSIIYNSADNGATWTEVVDLNDFTEGSGPVNGVSSAILYNNDFVVGATNGNIFAQTKAGGIVQLNSPT